MRPVLAAILLMLCSGVAYGVDISDPKQFMFVGDRVNNTIDVISLHDNEVVYRIETSIHPDHIIATPFAPILLYTDTSTRQAAFYDLRKRIEFKPIDLPITPRHVVLDTTGAKVAVTDNIDGGFVLLHAYKMSIEFVLDDFPATGDVLFDPNDVDIYFSNQASGSLGMLDVNTHRIYEMPLTDVAGQVLSAPSRSLDARYIYVSNITSGEVYSLNAYSRIIFNTFEIGGKAARPYTTPQGAFLYMMDEASGRFVSVEQRGFTEFAEVSFEHGVDLVVVGRFDRMNLLASTSDERWSIFDNVSQKIVATGKFNGVPIEALGSADGKYAYVAFADAAEVAIVDLEDQEVSYAAATDNGSAAFTVGLSNNVCH
jgi:DNA-binding beta-propeller fold protein YncE